MIVNAFTCSGAYAVLIMSGLKRVENRVWNEGYPNWWILSNIRRLPTPIPCRGNVGMWRLPSELSGEVEKQFVGES